MHPNLYLYQPSPPISSPSTFFPSHLFHTRYSRVFPRKLSIFSRDVPPLSKLISADLNDNGASRDGQRPTTGPFSLFGSGTGAAVKSHQIGKLSDRYYLEIHAISQAIFLRPRQGHQCRGQSTEETTTSTETGCRLHQYPAQSGACE